MLCSAQQFQCFFFIVLKLLCRKKVPRMCFWNDYFTKSKQDFIWTKCMSNSRGCRKKGWRWSLWLCYWMLWILCQGLCRIDGCQAQQHVIHTSSHHPYCVCDGLHCIQQLWGHGWVHQGRRSYLVLSWSISLLLWLLIFCLIAINATISLLPSSCCAVRK